MLLIPGLPISLLRVFLLTTELVGRRNSNHVTQLVWGPAEMASQGLTQSWHTVAKSQMPAPLRGQWPSLCQVLQHIRPQTGLPRAKKERSRAASSQDSPNNNRCQPTPIRVSCPAEGSQLGSAGTQVCLEAGTQATPPTLAGHRLQHLPVLSPWLWPPREQVAQQELTWPAVQSSRHFAPLYDSWDLWESSCSSRK